MSEQLQLPEPLHESRLHRLGRHVLEVLGPIETENAYVISTIGHTAIFPKEQRENNHE